ncbi:MAG: hypothetical protein QNL91_01590, partial [Candidatus Krumholzibacteria bacterium]|nr:hypothetical protein [Candidatus Krumholzibacteria bacterium]
MRNLLLKTVLTLSLLLVLQPVSMPLAQEAEWNISSFGNEIRDLTTTVNPAVVQIYTSSFGALVGSVPQGAALFGQQQATGSGVILDASGYIVTNNHVVRGAKRVQV